MSKNTSILYKLKEASILEMTASYQKCLIDKMNSYPEGSPQREHYKAAIKICRMLEPAQLYYILLGLKYDKEYIAEKNVVTASYISQLKPIVNKVIAAIKGIDTSYTKIHALHIGALDIEFLDPIILYPEVPELAKFYDSSS